MRNSFLIIIILTSSLFGQSAILDSLKTIRAFQLIEHNLASSGYITEKQFGFIKDYGFKHVISLLPGDQSKEDSIVTSKGLTFTQIKVDWKNPTQENLKHYFDDMEKHKNDSVLLHCQANMRASAFTFLYRVIWLGDDKKLAKTDLDSIWFPTGQWHRFIEESHEKYNMGQEYRFENDFVQQFRKEGIKAVEDQLDRILEKGDGSLPFKEIDFQRVADELYQDEKIDEAIEVYSLNTKAFPSSWKAFEKLAKSLMETNQNQAAVESYKKVLELKPDFIWARRMLGMLGEREYLKFWSGIKLNLKRVKNLVGRYDFDNNYLDFIIEGNKFYLLPSWSKEKFQIYSDTTSKFFSQEKNWTFEFDTASPGKVTFTTPSKIYIAKKFNQ
ncbi:MAG: hypothetical protein D8M58_10200 [Calditrichaeota bacterium]|nr:MAG: hypothetical protein DWQ03_09575 [Calditrichota bacterium]MBL1205760.1 hypothetical protein [Calditrichota bacterium]NOG45588.1 hypothetical protein [Calditrichota bacterium]